MISTSGKESAPHQSAAPASAGSEEDAGQRTGRLNVLMIEDNPGDARLVQETLNDAEGVQFDLVWGKTLAEGLDKLDPRVDLVLLDLSLPDSHGPETFSKVKQRARNLPIIVLTGLNDEEAAMRTMTAGAQDYLVKGELDTRLIVRAIRYAIERKKTQDQLELYAEELRRKNAEIEEELDLAREIQQALIPRKFPSFPHKSPPDESMLKFFHRYIPTTALAGDFFEILDISDTQAGIFICDVMGHGVRSALVAGILRGLIEEQTSAAADPEVFLSEINRCLITVLRHTQAPMFATAFYIVADLVKRELAYASAGHPRPIRLSRETADIGRLPLLEGRRGPALGFYKDAEFPVSRCAMHPQDLVVLFTDGIYEAENSKGEAFLDDRMLDNLQRNAALPTGRLFDSLLSEVRGFSATGQFDDDVCLVGVEIAIANADADG